MKQLAVEIKEHFKADFNLFAYSYIAVLAITLISINYIFDFEHTVIQETFGKAYGTFVYILYYATPYFLGIIPVLVIKKQFFKLKQKNFWIKSTLFLIIMGSFSAFYQYRIIAEKIGNNSAEINYLIKLFSNLKKFIPYLIALYCIYLIFDRKNKNFYGLKKYQFNYKPFLIMLLMVLPLVIAASFLPDFGSYYPRFKYWNYTPVFDLNKLQMNVIFLCCYAMDFISVELIFRGALVIGMFSVLGREAVLSAALLYIVFHFGKPIGETISSFFGAYILGIFAYKHKNILGGILVHIGLAWMMEFAAIIQYLRVSS